MRVHRSAIVNRGLIREMQPWFMGDYVLVMRTGARIVSGRTYRDAVHELLARPSPRELAIAASTRRQS